MLDATDIYLAVRNKHIWVNMIYKKLSREFTPCKYGLSVNYLKVRSERKARKKYWLLLKQLEAKLEIYKGTEYDHIPF